MVKAGPRPGILSWGGRNSAVFLKSSWLDRWARRWVAHHSPVLLGGGLFIHPFMSKWDRASCSRPRRIQEGHADNICSAHPHLNPPHPPSTLLPACKLARHLSPSSPLPQPLQLHCTGGENAAVSAAKLATLRELLRKRRADGTQRGGKRVTRTTAYRRLSHLSLSSVACPSRSFSPGNLPTSLLGSRHSSSGCPPPPARAASVGKRTGILSVSCLLSHNFSSAPSATHWQLRDEVTLVAPAPFLTLLPTASWGPFLPLRLPFLFLFFSPGGSPCLLHPAFNPSSPAFSSVSPLLPLGRTPAVGPDSGTKKTSPRAHMSVQWENGWLERPANRKLGGWWHVQ